MTMKKILVLIVVLAIMALALAGCCTKTDANGIATKSFSNCLASASNVACNPTPAVIATVQAAVTIISTAISLAVPGTAAWVAAMDAQNIASIILSGACVTTTQLDSLITWLSSDAAKVAQAQVAAKKIKTVGIAMTPLNIQPLINWANGVK
jgi:hypothetical protein